MQGRSTKSRGLDRGTANRSGSGPNPKGTVLESGRASHAWLPLVAFLIAIVLDLYLVQQGHRNSQMIGCGADSGCAEVTRSHFSKLFGLPIGWLGLMIHGLLAGFIIIQSHSSSRRDSAERGRTEASENMDRQPSVIGKWTGVITWAAILGAVYFVGIQVLALGKLCWWCNATHGAAILGIWMGRRFLFPKSPGGPLHAYFGPAMAAGLVALLGMAQWLTPRESPRSRIVAAGESALAVRDLSRWDDRQKNLRIHNGAFELDALKYPHLGNLDATNLLVGFVDYTCPHCQELHAVLEQLVEQSPGQLGVVLLPARRNQGSSDVHWMMLTLFRARPERYAEIAESLWHFKLFPGSNQVSNRVAEAFGGADTMGKAMRTHLPEIESDLVKIRTVLATNRMILGVEELPQLFIGNQILLGVTNLAGLASNLTQKLALKTLKAPKAFLPVHVFDVGEKWAGAAFDFEATIENRGDATLRMEGVKLVATGRRLKGPPSFFPPGARATARLHALAPTNAGPFEIQMALLMNTEEREVPIRIVGRSKPLLTIDPPILDLGEASEGAVRTSHVVRVRLGIPAEVDLPSTDPTGFDVTLMLQDRHRAYDIIVSPRTNLPPGQYRGSIHVPIRAIGAGPVPLELIQLMPGSIQIPFRYVRK